MTATPARQRTPQHVVAERMAEAAADFLASLDATQRAKAQLPFDDEAERTAWSYTPGERAGLPLGEMDPRQQRFAHRLVASGLSRRAYVTASTIIGMENALEADDGFSDRPHTGREDRPSRFRDPGMYFVAVFGEPGGHAWGWRIGGHHVCLHNTIVEGRLASPTPTFFGSHPAEMRFVGPGLLRPLAGEEDLARELVHALDGELRTAAIIATNAPWDIVQSNRPYVEEGALPRGLREIFPRGIATERAMARRRDPNDQRDSALRGFSDAEREAIRYHAAQPRGLPAARMAAAQRELLAAIVRQYIDRLPDEIAEYEGARFAGAGLYDVHFAWAGGLERKQPHYYRLQAPRFLIEYDNVQNDVDHIHSVWRDPEGDFGADVLRQHHARDHAQAHR